MESIQPPALSRGHEFLALDRRVRDHLDHLFVAPDVVLERRHIEVADEDRALRFFRPQSGMRAHFIEKREFVLEFRIDFRVRLVAAGGNVKIMQGDLIF